MNKTVELPLIEPLYSTYHYQAAGTAILVNNPTIRNFYLNKVMILCCTRKFLSGFTSPEISILDSAWQDNPNFTLEWYPIKILKGYINPVIRELIDNDYYVYFNCIDDYYIRGKTWYRERHFGHDGLLCGYNQTDKTYCIYAYDNDWILQKFWTSQNAFNAGRKAMHKQNNDGIICGIKPKQDKIDFQPEAAYKRILKYLNSSLKKYPIDGRGNVYGIAVHDYIAMYIGKLFDGSIPYERMDRRIFRLIWEHKKVMQERIECMEKNLGLNPSVSHAYKKIVSNSDTIRLLYASHHLRRRDSILPIIQKKIISLRNQEEELLTNLINKIGGML